MKGKMIVVDKDICRCKQVAIPHRDISICHQCGGKFTSLENPQLPKYEPPKLLKYMAYTGYLLLGASLIIGSLIFAIRG